MEERNRGGARWVPGARSDLRIPFGPEALHAHDPAHFEHAVHLAAEDQHEVLRRDRRTALFEGLDDGGTIDFRRIVRLDGSDWRLLFARLDVAQCVDEDAAPVFLGFAVGLAGMVDPACRVAVDRAVDDVTAFQVEVEGVVRVGRIMRVATQGLLPGDDLGT